MSPFAQLHLRLRNLRQNLKLIQKMKNCKLEKRPSARHVRDGKERVRKDKRNSKIWKSKKLLLLV